MLKKDTEALSSEAGFWNSLYKNFLPLLFSAVVFTSFIALLRNKVPNISLYASGCLLFFAIYFISRFASKGRLDIQSQKSLPTELMSILVIGACLVMTFLREGQKDRGSDFNESLFRYQIPRWSYLLLLAGTTTVSYFLLLAGKKQGRRPLPRILISIPYIFLLSCTVWIPNSFYSLHTFYHAHAYCSSLYDVLNLAPLGELNTPFYGHLALFFLLPGKILQMLGIPGNIAVATFIAGCNFITLLATIYVVNKYTKNDGIFFILLLSLADPYLMMMPKLHFIKDVYLQMIPHRVLFPALISAFMVASTDKKFGKGRILAAYLLAALSLEWSGEIGLVCIATISLYVFLRLFNYEAPLSFQNLRQLGFCALMALLAIFAAYLLVLGYDFLTSGKGLSFVGFMYPILGEFKSIAVRGPLPDLLRTWFPVLLFFLTVAAVSATKIIKRESEKEKQIGILCIAVIAIGLLTYYIDSGLQIRLMICFFQFIMLLALLLDSLSKEEQERKTGIAFTLLALLVTSTFVLGNAGMKEVLSDRRNTAWQVKNLAEFASELDQEIPDGTIAFGWGIPDLYAAMGRDPGVHVIDWITIAQEKNPIFLTHVNSLLVGTDRFFAYEDSADLLSESKNFTIEKEYEYKGWKFALYRRK